MDRFGLLPEAGQNLFRLSLLKLRAAPLGIRKIDVGAHGGRVEFVERPELDPLAIVRLIESAPDAYRMSDATTLHITRELADLDSRVDALAAVLDALSPAHDAHPPAP